MRDERIYRIVMNNPIPDKLFRDLRNAPLRTGRLGRHNFLTMSPLRYEVLKYLARGLTNRQIAIETGRSYQTVKWCVVDLLDYFDVPNRTVLAALCFRERIV